MPDDISITEAAAAIGVRCIIIDENTDWSKMPSLTQLLGYESDEAFLAAEKQEEQARLEAFRKEVTAIKENIRIILDGLFNPHIR